MKIQIEIECETIGELLQHIHELKLSVVGKRKREGLTESDGFLSGEGLNDSNCYGTHEVIMFSAD